MSDQFRWIPVEEALPEDRREKVLVCGIGFDGTAELGIGWYIGGTRGWDRAGGFIETVTHWARIRMPEGRGQDSGVRDQLMPASKGER